MDIIYAPSLMSANWCDLGSDLKLLDNYVCMYHADVMDAHFAKNLALSPAMIKTVKSATSLPVEAHLMTDAVNVILDPIIDAGADVISLHIEAIQSEAFRQIRKIKASGRKAGLVLCPATSLDSVKYLLGEIDMLTIMTVDIGYPGQKFIEAMLPKIKEADLLKKENKYSYTIQVDGGVCPQNFKTLYDAGARAFVMGASALFIKGVPLKESCENLYKNYEAQIGAKNI